MGTIFPAVRLASDVPKKITSRQDAKKDTISHIANLPEKPTTRCGETWHTTGRKHSWPDYRQPPQPSGDGWSCSSVDSLPVPGCPGQRGQPTRGLRQPLSSRPRLFRCKGPSPSSSRNSSITAMPHGSGKRASAYPTILTRASSVPTAACITATAAALSTASASGS